MTDASAALQLTGPGMKRTDSQMAPSVIIILPSPPSCSSDTTPRAEKAERCGFKRSERWAETSSSGLTPVSSLRQILAPLEEAEEFTTEDFHLLEKITLGGNADKVRARVKQMGIKQKKYVFFLPPFSFENIREGCVMQIKASW